jgi:hypothetical protein
LLCSRLRSDFLMFLIADLVFANLLSSYHFTVQITTDSIPQTDQFVQTRKRHIITSLEAL